MLYEPKVLEELKASRVAITEACKRSSSYAQAVPLPCSSAGIISI